MDFYTHNEALERAGVSQPTWWRWNAAGEGPVRIKVSNIWIYPKATFDQWLANRNQPQQQPAE